MFCFVSSECRFSTQPIFQRFALGLSVTLLPMVEKVCTINTSLHSMYIIYLSSSGLQILSLHWVSVPFLVHSQLITGPGINVMTSHHIHFLLHLDELYGKLHTEPMQNTSVSFSVLRIQSYPWCIMYPNQRWTPGELLNIT